MDDDSLVWQEAYVLKVYINFANQKLLQTFKTNLIHSLSDMKTKNKAYSAAIMCTKTCTADSVFGWVISKK